MSFQKTYRLLITPQPQVTIISSEKWITGVSEDYLKDYGEKKNNEQVDKGSKAPVNPNYYNNKRKRFLRYIQYQKDLKAESIRQRFFPRTHDFWIKYYLPMPASWGRKKRLQLNFEPHLQRPDIKNLNAAFEDSLFEEDKIIYDYRASKFWIDLSYGFIDIEIGTLPIAKGYTKIILKGDELL